MNKVAIKVVKEEKIDGRKNNTGRPVNANSARQIRLNKQAAVKEKMEADPHFIPVMGMEAEHGKGAVVGVKFMDSVKEMDYVAVKDDSACDAIHMALEVFDNVLFCNGGDRGSVNTPEYNEYRNDDRVEFKWGVGGTDKKNSSSWILKKWNML